MAKVDDAELLKTEEEINGKLDELSRELRVQSQAMLTIMRERLGRVHHPMRLLEGSRHMMTRAQAEKLHLLMATITLVGQHVGGGLKRSIDMLGRYDGVIDAVDGDD